MDGGIYGAHLSELLSSSREGFVHALERRELSSDYLRQAGDIIDGFIVFCQQPRAGQAWQVRRQFLHARHRERQGRGYGLILTHRARIVTRRLLHWLEDTGLLAEGTAAEGARWLVSRHPSATTSWDEAGGARAMLVPLDSGETP